VMFGGAKTTSIPIANNPALIGVELTCQATATATANLFGMATSNGLSVMVGN